VLVDAGGRLADPFATQTEPAHEYATEQVGLLSAADVVLVPAAPDGRTAGPEATPLTGLPTWSLLPAARAGRVFPIPYGAASLGAGFTLLDRLGEILTALA